MSRIARNGIALRLALAMTVSVVLAGAGQAMSFTGWGPASKVDEIGGNHQDLNTTSLDGCPIQSPDGLSLYMASNRPGSSGLDIWVATRASADGPWGAPERLPEPINSASDDFCPTPVRGNGLFFVSRRTIAGVTCGLGDIYFARRNPAHGWSEPAHLGCAPNGPNSELDEQGPSRVELNGHEVLYFSRSTLPPGTSGEIFMSTNAGGDYGPAVAVAELNVGSANDIQPNVRKDGRELVFSSTRPGGAGGQDLWVATRDGTDEPWSTPVNLGPAVNTAFSETRPSLSWDAGTLYFGRQAAAPGQACPSATPCTEGGTGMTDIYVSTRDRANGVARGRGSR